MIRDGYGTVQYGTAGSGAKLRIGRAAGNGVVPAAVPFLPESGRLAAGKPGVVPIASGGLPGLIGSFRPGARSSAGSWVVSGAFGARRCGASWLCRRAWCLCRRARSARRRAWCRCRRARSACRRASVLCRRARGPCRRASGTCAGARRLCHVVSHLAVPATDFPRRTSRVQGRTAGIRVVRDGCIGVRAVATVSRACSRCPRSWTLRTIHRRRCVFPVARCYAICRNRLPAVREHRVSFGMSLASRCPVGPADSGTSSDANSSQGTGATPERPPRGDERSLP